MVRTNSALTIWQLPSWVNRVVESIPQHAVQSCSTSRSSFRLVPGAVLVQSCAEVDGVGPVVVHTRSSRRIRRAEACALSSAAEAP